MPLTAADCQARLEFALDIVRETSRFILQYYQARDLEVERKRDATPVTEADRGAERLIRAALAQHFPADGILGEEYGESPGTNGCRWILDPVDGTKSFIHGVPLFGTLIGLEVDGECVMGVCQFPALDEVVWGARGSGAWWRQGTGAPRRARASQVADLGQALFCITTIAGWERVGRKGTFDRLCSAAGLTRGWGDCYGHILVATGRADVMIDPLMNPWDAAALIPIMEEAGGRFVDWQGAVSIHTGNGVSVNAPLAGAVLEILRA